MPHWVQLTALLLVVLQFCAQVTRNRITVTNTYDQVGNKLSVQDGNLHTTTFAYDGLNRNTAVTDATGKSTALTYDALNKTQRTDALGQITTYLYDSRNRLTHVVYNSAAAANSQRNYAYDNVGNLLSVTEPAKIAANVAYGYDALNRAVSETSNGQTHTYLYDLAGNRLQTVYGGTSRTITSTYDALNRLSTMTETGRTTGYGYDLNGNITRKTAPNGDLEAYAFDALNRCSTESAQTVGAASLFNYAYGYDLVGNVLTVGETYPAGLNNRTVANTYDAINRLLVEAVAASVNVTTTYAYDNANNRTSKAIVGGNGAGSTSYTYNSLDQLTGYSDGTRSVSLTYDNNGNRANRVVSGSADAGADTYSYDFENRLIGLVKGTSGGAGTYAYQYDYRTRRIVRDESNAGGTITNLVFSGGTSVQEYDGATPSLTVEYIRGSDYGGGVGGILYTIRNGTPSYTHENKRGDVVAKTDGSGNLTYQAQYEAFGKQVATAGSTLDRQKSNSKDTDPTNLVDEGMRYRDLETGMFLNRDPAGFVDGPNLYTYVVQNPWTKFDPEGLDAQNVSDNDVAAAVSRAQAANPKEQNALGAMVYTAAGRIIQFGANHQDSLKTTRNDIQAGLMVASVGVEGKLAAESSGLFDGASSATISAPKLSLNLAPAADAPKTFPNQFPEDPIGTPSVIPNSSLAAKNAKNLNYVVDADGKLTVGYQGSGPGGGHIDLAGGQPVQAAGEATIANGQVKALDNASGHYQPTGPSAQSAAETAFQNQGLTVKPGAYQEKTFVPGKGWTPVTPAQPPPKPTTTTTTGGTP